jgi:hypothetical protein
MTFIGFCAGSRAAAQKGHNLLLAATLGLPADMRLKPGTNFVFWL